MFVTADGTLRSFGQNAYSSLGLGPERNRQELVLEPQEVSLTSVVKLLPHRGYDLVALANGEAHALALTRSGEVRNGKARRGDEGLNQDYEPGEKREEGGGRGVLFLFFSRHT
jgi:alpha-tubulin suppressor-like RCC1 family protein